MTTNDIHSRLLMILMDRSVSVRDLAERLQLDQQEIFNVLQHAHFTRVAGAGGWEWTAAGNALHIKEQRTNVRKYMPQQPKHVNGVIPHDATADHSRQAIRA